MQLLDWKALPQEQMNQNFSRKVVHGEKITLAQIFLKRGGIVPEHHHENEQISMVVTGSLKVLVEGSEVLVRSSELLVIPPQKRHSVEALEDSLVYDIFSPIRQDWLDGKDDYLRK